MWYSVVRDGTLRLTLQEGTDTTACAAATDELAGTLAELVETGALTGWEIRSTTVFEHPTAPFEPYTIELSFSARVTVEAETTDAALDRGEASIDAALERAGVEPTSDGAPTVASIP